MGCLFTKVVHKFKEASMSIRDRLVQFKTVAVAVIGFIRRHPRASMAVAMAVVVLGPLLTGSGGGAFFLNLAGLGIAALVVRRIMQAGKGRQAGCRRNCHRQNSRKSGGTT